MVIVVVVVIVVMVMLVVVVVVVPWSAVAVGDVAVWSEGGCRWMQRWW